MPANLERAPSVATPSRSNRRNRRGRDGAARDRLRSAGTYSEQRGLVSPDGQRLVGQIGACVEQIADGDNEAAKAALHEIADLARNSGDSSAEMMAGKLWEVADALLQATDATAAQDYASAKTHASAAADIARALHASGTLPAGALQRVIASAGGLWNTAEEAQQTGEGGASGTPMIDQHRLNHERGGAFCGIASMLMVLRANGKNPPTETRAQIQRLAEGIYHKGSGTSGAGMAQRLRDNGIADAAYTTDGGMGQIVGTLQSGQPVPLGVMHSEGEVVKLNDGGSKRYPHLRPGARHFHQFGGSGHWLVVVSFEGKPEAPSAFLVNDPDIGGQLRVTPDELQSMARANRSGSGMWMVHQ